MSGFFEDRLVDILRLVDLEFRDIETTAIDEMILLVTGIYNEGVTDGMGKGLQMAADSIAEEMGK